MLHRVVMPLSLLAIVAGSPAQAALPDPVKDMLEAAIESGNKDDVNSIAKFAKQTNPDDAAEIDAMVAAYSANQAQLAAAKKQEQMEAPFFKNWSGQGELGGFRNTGNSSNTGLSGGIRLTKDAVKWRLKFRARADYQRSSGRTTREQFSATIEPDYKINGRLFAYGLAQFERDRFQGFSSRYTLSGGLGYTVIKEDDVTLDIKAGPAWRLTEFTDGGSDSSLAGLIGLDFGWQIAENFKLTQGAGATLTSEAETFNTTTALFSSGSNTFTSTTGLTANLIGSLSARLSYTVEHETSPPEGREKTDTLSRATLVYDF